MLKCMAVTLLITAEGYSNRFVSFANQRIVEIQNTVFIICMNYSVL